MDTDRNLLFGVLALQADLIDPKQFVEACLLWTSRKDVPLADLLVERGWIVPDDKAHVGYLLGRKLHKHGGDLRASLDVNPCIRDAVGLTADDVDDGDKAWALTLSLRHRFEFHHVNAGGEDNLCGHDAHSLLLEILANGLDADTVRAAV